MTYTEKRNVELEIEILDDVINGKNNTFKVEGSRSSYDRRWKAMQRKLMLEIRLRIQKKKEFERRYPMVEYIN